MSCSLMVAGAGKIGSLIACLLSQTGDYEVHLVDVTTNPDLLRLKEQLPHLTLVEIDVRDSIQLSAYIRKEGVQGVISCLPYYFNVDVAKIAKQCHVHYFDLTEDVKVTQQIKEMANHASSVFVPQCGLAPGFITIVANSLIKEFDTVRDVKMRVGALPSHSSNVLHYSLTWSTDGVLNEYGQPCYAIENGQYVVHAPLEGLEQLEIDGMAYEAFNTSGGLGSLPQLYEGKVQNMNYKTVRYPGHCEKMRFLMNDLGLNGDRDTLKRILERVIPKTYQDMVLVYVAVNGLINGQFLEKHYVNKLYPATIAGLTWSAIQATTASGVCAVVDKVLMGTKKMHGLVLQEEFSLSELLANRFGKYYATDFK